MSLNIEITVSDKASQRLRAITRNMTDKRGLHGSIAEGVLAATRRHLDKNYVPRNKRGDFWADVRNSLEAVADGNGATVSMQELGLRLRYHGGTVTPGKSISSYTGKPTKALAIPSEAVPVAKGRQIRPGRAGLLAFIRSKTLGKTVGYLVEGEKRAIGRGKNKGNDRIIAKAGGNLLYTLRTITTHKADKKILPPDSALEKAAIAAIRDFLGNPA